MKGNAIFYEPLFFFACEDKKEKKKKRKKKNCFGGVKEEFVYCLFFN